jgi:hypothetical protein
MGTNCVASVDSLTETFGNLLISAVNEWMAVNSESKASWQELSGIGYRSYAVLMDFPLSSFSDVILFQRRTSSMRSACVSAAVLSIMHSRVQHSVQ